MSPEHRRVPAPVRTWAVALLLLATLPAAPTVTVRAQQFTPATVAQLIAAITTANSNTLDNIITLTAGAIYTLTTADNIGSGVGDESGLPRITGSHTLTINGNGATIERSGAPNTPHFRIFAVNNGASLTLIGLTLRNGSVAGSIGSTGVSGGSAAGGAIFVANGGTLAVTNCLLSSNSVLGGAGGDGSAGVNNSTTGNGGTGGFGGSGGDARGGAIGNLGTLNVRGSTFTGNSATAGAGGKGGNGGNAANGFGGVAGFGGTGGIGVGGALDNVGTATIVDSTFAANTATGGGGGNGGVPGAGSSGSGAPVQGANGGSGAGGGISHGGSGTTIATNITVAGNSATGGAPGTGGAGSGAYGVGVGGGIRNGGVSIVTVTNTLLAANSAGDGNCGGNSIQDGGHNLDFDPAATCFFANNAQTLDPVLGSLVNHGGPTPTLDIAPGGAAAGKGDPAVCGAASVGGVDQRGLPRPAACSIGAFEPQAAAFPTLTALSPPSGSVAGGASVTLTGTGFVSGATATFGTAATTVSVISPTVATATVPAHASGVVDVTITNADMQAATLTVGYTYGNVTTLPGAKPTDTPGGVPSPRPPIRVPGTPTVGTPPNLLPAPR